jgi:hypothetical protein
MVGLWSGMEAAERSATLQNGEKDITTGSKFSASLVTGLSGWK